MAFRAETRVDMDLYDLTLAARANSGDSSATLHELMKAYKAGQRYAAVEAVGLFWSSVKGIEAFRGRELETISLLKEELLKELDLTDDTLGRDR